MTPLTRHLAGLIAREGPISVATYMSTALMHPEWGYYATRDPFGAAGDFVTAPEISQMFGELIGLWIAETWASQGRPSPFALVELGPGRGTLMSDLLRATRRVAPDFAAAAHLHLIEASPTLRALQREKLRDTDITWHASLDKVPDLPLLLIANEFFDALPVRQFVRSPQGWCERCIGLAGESEPRFVFVAAPEPLPETLIPETKRSAPVGSVVELCPAGEALMEAIAARLQAQGGAALVIDYGTDEIGATLQAVRHHAFHDPLVDPGSADLTAHVDFSALAHAADGAGAQVSGPLTQGKFLERLGISARAAILKKNALLPADIDTAHERLTSPAAMGTLFKVMAVMAKGAHAPAFDG